MFNPWHNLHQSRLPSLLANIIFLLVISVLTFLYFNILGPLLFNTSTTLLTCGVWFLCIALESGAGYHTPQVNQNLIGGFLWFLLSELILFVSIFWSFLDAALNPPIQIGGVWPPIDIPIPENFGLPLLNTVILLSSSITLTLAHNRSNSGHAPVNWIILTTLLGGTFLLLQNNEYEIAPFTISDTIFGSCFYLGTGLHIIHVLVGTLWLTLNLLGFKNYFFTVQSIVGFELSILYWHFVDIVWLCLWTLFY